MVHVEAQHRRRSAVGGVVLGVVISALFLALSSVAAFVILELRERVKGAEEDVRQNAIYLATWDGEIAARRADIKDLEHFFPSHGHPAPNPQTTNPTIPPTPHD